MLDTLILASALIAGQAGYEMPSAAPPMPRSQRPADSAAPVPPPKPTVAAVPGKSLQDLPNTTIRYFDVSGRNLKAINKSIERNQAKDASGKVAAAPTGWAIDTTFNKTTSGGQCKVTDAKATFSANVVLPRLVSDSSHSPELVATWQAYLASVENAQAADLWFVNDRVREIESAVLASSCDSARNAADSAVGRLRAQAAEFQRARATPAPAAN